MGSVSEAFAVAIGHHQAGRLQAAEQIYRQILQVDPRHADAIHMLGVLAGQAGQHAAAAQRFEQAISLAPDRAGYYVNLGEAYRALGRMPEATACCRRAVQLAPNDEGAYHNLGSVLKDQGQLAEAIACYRRAVQLSPQFAEAHYNLGVALQEQKQFAEAAACYRRAAQLQPDSVPAHNNLGNVLTEMGQHAEAIACFHRALKLNPNHAAVYSNLGNTLKADGQSTEAIACFRRALQLQPDLAEAHNNLGGALRDQGQVDEAIACFRRAVQLKPDYVAAHNNLVSVFNYQSGTTPAQLADVHREFERQQAAPLQSAWRPHDNSRDPQRRLRLGFVSPDFHRHPVGFFLIRALENLDREQCEIVCYNDPIIRDELTARFQAAATVWRDVAGQNDQRLAEQIRDDRIDILFDLAGHTARNRLLVFARKPAPIQITWIGYEGTTGLSAMDYLLADRYMVPPGVERHYRERVLRMPEGYVCYDPPPEAPAVSSLPALAAGHVTFGCFNNPAKTTAQVVEAWSRILRRLPKARLRLKYRVMSVPAVASRFTDLFAAQGVDAAQLDFQGQSPYAEYLASYGQIDLALDPFPFTGGITTCEALWMGVPVITCPGETFASRHSLSHLSNAGLTETIARDLDEYVELAVSLTGDLPRLAALRAGLRERMAASPLCDGKRFAANLMSMLHDVWKQYC